MRSMRQRMRRGIGRSRFGADFYGARRENVPFPVEMPDERIARKTENERKKTFSRPRLLAEAGRSKAVATALVTVGGRSRVHSSIGEPRAHLPERRVRGHQVQGSNAERGGGHLLSQEWKQPGWATTAASNSSTEANLRMFINSILPRGVRQQSSHTQICSLVHILAPVSTAPRPVVSSRLGCLPTTINGVSGIPCEQMIRAHPVVRVGAIVSIEQMVRAVTLARMRRV